MSSHSVPPPSPAPPALPPNSRQAIYRRGLKMIPYPSAFFATLRPSIPAIAYRNRRSPSFCFSSRPARPPTSVPHPKSSIADSPKIVPAPDANLSAQKFAASRHIEIPSRASTPCDRHRYVFPRWRFRRYTATKSLGPRKSCPKPVTHHFSPLRQRSTCASPEFLASTPAARPHPLTASICRTSARPWSRPQREYLLSRPLSFQHALENLL